VQVFYFGPRTSKLGQIFEASHRYHHAVRRDGIPAPSGIGRWNHTTIRNIIASELYAPHAYDEVTALVAPGVAARLDRGAVYGLWTWNTRKTTRRKVWDEKAGEFKIRYNYAPRPREEWLFVPVPAAGVTREVVEAAKQSLKDNARRPSYRGRSRAARLSQARREGPHDG
jgi:Recombinase